MAGLLWGEQTRGGRGIKSASDAWRCRPLTRRKEGCRMKLLEDCSLTIWLSVQQGA